MTMSDRNPVSVDVAGTTLRATDIGGNSLSFDLTGWDPLADSRTFDEPIDVAVAGRVSKLGYDLRNTVGIDRLDDGPVDSPDPNRETWADCVMTVFDDKRVVLESGEYFLRFDAALFVRLRFDGAATVRHRPGAGLTISFSQPTPVTFGFKSPVDYPRHEIVVEPTTAGIATGLSHLSASIETTTADRVHRNYRGYPPLLALGEETRVPDAVAAGTPETGIELLVPDRLDALVSGASLAYYLSARLRPSDVPAPVLRAPEIDLAYEFDAPVPFETAAPALLRRVFFLDQMASWSDPETPTTREFSRLAAAGIDLNGCRDEPIAERLATYLSFQADVVDGALPPWPYVVFVEPTVSNVRSLPHLLYDMAAITPAGTASVGRAVDHGERAAEPTAADELRRGRLIRGVLGTVDGASGFTAVQRAYENRIEHLGRGADDRVVVVFGPEIGVDVDRRAIVDRYAQRSTGDSVPTRRLDAPSTGELADVFAAGADFLHYVGRCEGDGIVCADGVCRPADLDENAVSLFQLDAPKSRAAGLALVEAGSIAGVTRQEKATLESVSTMIGELVLYGHCLAAAHRCARGSEADPGAVVGDGTHRFVAKWRNSPLQVLAENDDGSVEITVVPFSVDPVGAHWVQDWSDGKYLNPTAFSYTVPPGDLHRYFSTNEYPVYYDGQLYWMAEQKRLVYPVS
jgi:hypothetical protein